MVHPQAEKIADLRQAVEQRLGRSVNTPTEFKRLCEDIKRLTDVVISQSTLMRIWGYVNSSAKPSDTILNALAVYAGYTDFMSFATHDDQEASSDVLGSRISVCDDLSVRDRVQLTWQPGRICLVRYLGDEQFVVEQSQATRLQPGDTFECGLLIDGEPLYLDNLCQPGCAPSAYVCGQVAGIRYELLETKITEHI